MQTMTTEERNLYFLIARGYMAQFYPVHLYDQTKVEVTYKDELFTASGRTERDLGWKVMYQTAKKKAADEDSESENDSEDGDGTLPVMKKKDNVAYEKGDITQRATKPPVRFTESTLLAGSPQSQLPLGDPDVPEVTTTEQW